MIDFLFENTEDVLNIALSISVILVSFFLSLVLVRLFRTLGILNDFILDLQDTLEIIQNYLWQPARFFLAIKKKILSLFSFLGTEKTNKKKKK